MAPHASFGIDSSEEPDVIYARPPVCEPDSSLHSKKTNGDEDFAWSKSSEPHAIRKKLVMAAHPEVKQLMGPCPNTKWKVLATVCFQALMAYNLRSVSFPVLFVFTYFVAGTLNGMSTLAVHELSHNLGFKGSPTKNRLLALFANIPMGVPAAVSFKRYHMEHHKYQGEDNVDADIPGDTEAWLFGHGVPGKAVWMMLQPAFYAIRPLVLCPKVPGKWEYINFVFIAFTNYLFYSLGGLNALFYIIGGTLIGMGIHPSASHFVAEHFLLEPGYETMSYYGPLNWMAYNVGYHNEHHDFPNIPGSRLHLLREIAPEFYETLPQYASWTKVLFDFIFRADLSGYSRVKRITMTEDQRKDLTAREQKAHFAS